jgi:hypothetical protein
MAVDEDGVENCECGWIEYGPAVGDAVLGDAEDVESCTGDADIVGGVGVGNKGIPMA